ncbi:MAG: DNA topoisomerase IB [Ferruginibacter sp.]|nr:DNA topoisomerase IB [Ferruginibacter sp.]
MAETVDVLENISKSQIKKIIHDPVKTAEAIDLVYVSDSLPGIVRQKKGTSFSYIMQNKRLTNEMELQRIKKLVLPPAWENVWICALHNGHLQATGLDVKKRKQYRYHPSWNALRNHTKFYRMQRFGKLLPVVRLQLEKDLLLEGLPKEKILATVVSLMERTNIRVGNNVYEKLYGSFGLTTLKDTHVKIDGVNLKFSFRGKKGIQHDISLKNKKLASVVQKSKDIPGKELFQYYDETGKRHSIDSGMVNDYLKNICGEDFTAKDFRTWAGTVNAFLAFKEIGMPETETAVKKNILEALDKVASQLGNTRTVCKKYYVNPLIISLYESKDIEKYFKQLDAIETDDNKSGLTADEKIIMKILEAN